MNGEFCRPALLAGAALLAMGCSVDGPDEPGEASGIDHGSAGDTETEGTGGPSGDEGADAGMTDADATGEATGGETGSGGPTGDDASTTGGGDDGTTSEGQGDLLFLAVDPAETIVELDLNTPGSQDYIVTAHYENGDAIDVTAEATWDVANPTVGSMTGATLDIPSFDASYFGSSVLTATVDGMEGRAQLTVAAYVQSGDEPDFFFVLPYNDPAGDQTKQLTFNTDVKRSDIFFNVDTTGSMRDEIENMQTSLSTVIVPGIDAILDDAQYGVGAMEDFPEGGYGNDDCNGNGPDQPFELFSEITGDVVAVQSAINQLDNGGAPIGCGADWPESHVEAMYQIATGEGLDAPGDTFVAANASGVGGVGFREDALPIVVNITDAMSHDAGDNTCSAYNEQYTAGGVPDEAHTQTEAMDAMGDICARVIQVATQTAPAPGCGAEPDGIEWNNATGAVVPPEAWNVAGHPAGCAIGECCTGINGTGVAPDGSGMCPLTYRAQSNGTGVDNSIVAGIEMVAQYALFDATREWEGVDTDNDGAALPAGTTTADFIKAVVPFDHGVVPVPGIADPTLTPTTFEGVVPATDVTFDVDAFNDFVPQGPQPRLFTATIRVLADDCGELDERDVFILVPPAELPDPS